MIAVIQVNKYRDMKKKYEGEVEVEVGLEGETVNKESEGECETVKGQRVGT